MCNYASELKNSMCNYSQYHFSYRDFFRTNVESYIISNFLHEIFKKFRLGPAVPGEIGRDRRPGAGGDSQLRR